MDAASIASLMQALQATPGEPDGFGVWPENVETVNAFLMVTTQLRVVSIGGGFTAPRLIALGFDYAGVRAGLDAEGITVTPELWRGLRVMEDAAVAALNEGS